MFSCMFHLGRVLFSVLFHCVILLNQTSVILQWHPSLWIVKCQVNCKLAQGQWYCSSCLLFQDLWHCDLITWAKWPFVWPYLAWKHVLPFKRIDNVQPCAHHISWTENLNHPPLSLECPTKRHCPHLTLRCVRPLYSKGVEARPNCDGSFEGQDTQAQ